jgi:DNA-binding NarL/FixJ family response regulator
VRLLPSWSTCEAGVDDESADPASTLLPYFMPEQTLPHQSTVVFHTQIIAWMVGMTSAFGMRNMRCAGMTRRGRLWWARELCDSTTLLGVDNLEQTVRIVVADDHHFFRDGLRGMLEAGGMEVVGEASDGDEAVALVHSLRPDVLVLDLNMPGASGMEALRALARTCPEVQTVILTVSNADADVLAALAAGACGYLLKDTRADGLVSSIRQAAEGHMVLSGEVARALMAHVRAGADATAAADLELESQARVEDDRAALTPREAEVLRLLAEGADNTAIGLELSISPHTVKQYVANIFEKLGVRSRVQAAVHAVRSGLV